MVSLNTALNYSLLPPTRIWVLKFPAICLPPNIFLGPRRRKKPLPAVNPGCRSFGTWVLKKRHYCGEGESGLRSSMCRGWETEGDLALESAILEFMKKSEKPAAFPTKKELLDAGRVDLVKAIRRKGGWLSLGWDSDDENEDRSSEKMEITDTKLPNTEQEDASRTAAGHSQERVESGNSLQTGEVSSHSASSLQLEDVRGTGIEGLLSGLEKQRNLLFGINLEKDLHPARALSKQQRDDIEEAAVEISYNNKKIHDGRDSQVNDLFEMTEISNEVIGKQNDISNEEIRRRLQYFELELTSALRLLRSKSEKYVADEAHPTSDGLQNLSDAWEFQENDIMHAREKLRSLRAKLAVLEGRMELAVTDVRKAVEKKHMRVDSARRALELLRNACIVWPNSASEVLVTGSFDGWTTQRKMERSSSGIFSLYLKLYPGRYEIKFIVDGMWRVDPLRPVVDNEGYHNNLLIVT